MSIENQFVDLCHRFFDSPRKDFSPDKISSLFTRIISKNQKLKMTEEIRNFIPKLAAYDNGVFCSFLEDSIEGISPMHYVPELQLQDYSIRKAKAPKSPKSIRSSRNPRNRKSRPKTTRTPRVENNNNSKINDLPVYELKLPNRSSIYLNQNTANSSRPQSARRSKKKNKYLPPLLQNQNDVISHVFFKDSKKFFVAKKEKEESHDYNIIPPDYPKHAIGNNFSVIAGSGVVSLDGNKANVQDLPQFILDNENHFIVEKQLFRLHNSYRSFYTWRDRYKERVFKKLIKIIDDNDKIIKPGFSTLTDSIRQIVLEKTENLSIFKPDFEHRIDEIEFSEFQEIANIAIAEMDDLTTHLSAQVGMEIFEFFKQVRANNLLIQLTFEELHSLNALPESLKTFSSDLRWRYPSIWRQKLRDKMLTLERKNAQKRQNYLKKFFFLAHSTYTGNLIMQVQRIAVEFLQRFSQNQFQYQSSYLLQPKFNSKSDNFIRRRRTIKLTGIFDDTEGMKIFPTKEQFIKWIFLTVEEIKAAFLDNEKQISIDVINEIDPDFDEEVGLKSFEDPKIILSRYPAFKKLANAVKNDISGVYTYFTLEMHNHASFLKKLKESINSAFSLIQTSEDNSNINDKNSDNSNSKLREIETLERVIKDIAEVEKGLQDRPRNLYHKSVTNDELTDYVLDMRPALDAATTYFTEGVSKFKSAIINELNVNIFTEIQEKWAVIRGTRISRENCRYLEIRMVMYAVLSEIASTAWSDTAIQIKGTFDTIMRLYRDLNDKCPYTHNAAISTFNISAEKVGVSTIQNKKNDIQEYDDEEEEEEEINEISTTNNGQENIEVSDKFYLTENKVITDNNQQDDLYHDNNLIAPDFDESSNEMASSESQAD